MDNEAHEQTHVNIADSMPGVKERQSWRPRAMSSAYSLISDIKSRIYPFMNKATRLSKWYESFSDRLRPWNGWSPLSLEFQIDERRPEAINPASNVTLSKEQRPSVGFFGTKNNFGHKPLVRHDLLYPAIKLAILRTTPDNAIYKEGNAIIKYPDNNITYLFKHFLTDPIPSHSSSHLNNPPTYELSLIQNAARFPRREMQSLPLIQHDSIPSRAQRNDSMESPPVRWKAMDTVTSMFRSNDVQSLMSKELVEKSLNPGNRIPVQMLQERIGIENKKLQYSRISEPIESPFTQKSKSSDATYSSKSEDTETIAEHIIPRINKMSSRNEKYPAYSTVPKAVRFAEKNDTISKIGEERIHGSNPDTNRMVEKLIEHTIVPGPLPRLEMRILPENKSPKYVENEPEIKRSTDDILIKTSTQEKAPYIDINAVVDKVYLALLRRQQLERERRGLY